MTIHTTSIPKAAKPLKPVPFKLFFPRQLEVEQARPVWEALEAEPNIILGDPFALPGVSTVYPGVLYVEGRTRQETGLKKVAALVSPLQAEYPKELADGWVELWVPEALADAVEALDVTDLTQQ